MITQKDSLDFLQKEQDFAFDINYSDPPYALGSEIYICPNGKFDYKKATDFMNKWDMPTGEYWEKWFEESFRTLKHGGYCVMFGIDRQLPMFQYYAIKAGFQVRQSMYWYFISSFPKATDLSKNLDKNAKAERIVVGKKVRGDVQKAKEKGVGFLADPANRNNIKQFGYGVEDLTIPSTDLAKKYEGYKYSIAPLKQTCETIMIFQKPYKTGSCLHDTLAYENGDETCACFAWNIDGGRVSTDEQNLQGRYPSQTFCDISTAKRLDEQSGVFTSSKSNKVYDNNAENRNVKNSASGQRKPESTYGDTGGCSKILHKCGYENGEMDLYVYAPKVSKTERNAGCEELEIKKFEGRDSGQDDRSVPYKKRPEMLSNTHPTLKPISLSYRVLKLFKTPNPQKIVYPFAGVQSEVIGGYKAGFTNFIGCELSEEYVNIGNARFQHWKSKLFDDKGKLIEAKNGTKPKKKPNKQLKLL